MVIRICLYGKHSTRTPLAYKSYQASLENKIEIVADPLHADILVTGFSKDFYDNSIFLERILEKRVDLKLAVISEEPLWDSIYCLNYQDTISSNLCSILSPSRLGFSYFAHHNSNIFDYDSVPYFLTTDLRLPIRYLMLMSSWLLSSSAERTEFFSQNRRQFLLLAEKRIEDWFNYSNKQIGLSSLCIVRSEIGATLINTPGMDICGKGFTEAHVVRQNLSDWHLDKLSKAYMKYNIVSALENTLQRNYVTEKLFDAFSCCSMPLYSANPEHSVLSNLSLGSFINIFDRSSEESVSLVKSFAWTPDVILSYERDAFQIFGLLKNWGGIIDDIKQRSALMLNTIEERILV